MIDLALKLPHLITKPIPILTQKMNFSLTFTQEQLASLLANAFFCTFPYRNIYEDNSHAYDKLPSINFDRLMCTYKQGGLKIKIEKLKCILNYFRRVTQSMPKGLVTFTRRCVNEFPNFEKSNSKIFGCELRSENTIEDCSDALQMDFANKYIGGGVLSRGCVQEEIRFVLCPELLVSCLFCQVMQNNECILIRGFERFNSYKGYASTFEWNGDFADLTPLDATNHRQVELLALDALHFIDRRTQFSSQMITRELKKAYCGFKQDNEYQSVNQKIATGNWGCGAFNGDIQLKFLIQLMAAAECKRDLIYFTFGNEEICNKLKEIYEMLKIFEFTSAQIMALLKEYCQEIDKLKNKDKKIFKNFDLNEFFKTKFDFD
jgi:poly(ADP-ribose) glycohydrolase